jgi:hypothetical protein
VALSEKHRSRFYEHFVEHVGEEAAADMLAQFPTRDSDELVTKEHLDRRFAEVDVRFAHVDAEFARLRAELGAQLSAQTDRLMARMQWAVGMAFGFLAVLTTVVTLASN